MRSHAGPDGLTHDLDHRPSYVVRECREDDFETVIRLEAAAEPDEKGEKPATRRSP
jgi:hypothetical protein